MVDFLAKGGSGSLVAIVHSSNLPHILLNLQWDILSTGGVAEEFARIANGRDPGNCVSLLRVKVSCWFSMLLSYH